MEAVHTQLVELALSHVEGSVFERFFKEFASAIEGEAFVPIGGMHDGGADGYLSEPLYGTSKAGHFFQASVQKDARAKINKTVRDLKKNGRAPKIVTYYTSLDIPFPDKLEADLFEIHGCLVRLRARQWISTNVNRSAQTRSAFKNHLQAELAYLNSFGAGTVPASKLQKDAHRTVCVFLAQELDRRRGDAKLVHSVSDSLILFALEGTDPDADHLMTRDEILAKIQGHLPTAVPILRGNIDHRLAVLSSKDNPSGREIREYKKDGKYCLPFETRQLVHKENASDAILTQDVVNVFRDRAAEFISDAKSAIDPHDVASAAMQALHLTFEKQGLQMATALSSQQLSSTEPLPSTSDQVDEVMMKMENLVDPAEFRDLTDRVLRGAFYRSTLRERELLSKLSRTYFLMLSLSAEPKVIDYFQSMSSELVLFVGSDIIIRALTERYLDEQDQMTCTLLDMLKNAGAKLILSESTVSEVWGHIRSTDDEYVAEYSKIEPHVDWNIASHCRKIMIRSYFYARLDPLQKGERPRGWPSYVGNFCTYQQLHKKNAREELKLYLLERFGLEFLSADDLANLIDEEEVSRLSKPMEPLKESLRLAENDARQVLAVYGRRSQLREYHKNNPSGFKTWWLTQESRVLSVTGDLVREKGPYVMRPEFLLNFIMISPTTKATAEKFREVIPSLLGIRLTNRMRPEVHKKMLDTARSYIGKDDARVAVELGNFATQIKHGSPALYDTSLTAPFEEDVF